jgi:hypothetical protein
MGAAGCETEGTRLLRDICSRLPEASAVEALLAALAGGGNSSVTTFELLSSGAVKALKGYLQGADLTEDPDRQLRLLQRLGEFSGAEAGAMGAGGWGLLWLVQQLLDQKGGALFPAVIHSCSITDCWRPPCPALICCCAAAAVAPGSGADPPLGLLVGKLLGALASSEKFAVQLNPISPQPSLGSLYAGGYYRSSTLHSECS